MVPPRACQSCRWCWNPGVCWWVSHAQEFESAWDNGQGIGYAVECGPGGVADERECLATTLSPGTYDGTLVLDCFLGGHASYVC